MDISLVHGFSSARPYLQLSERTPNLGITPGEDFLIPFMGDPLPKASLRCEFVKVLQNRLECTNHGRDEMASLAGRCHVRFESPVHVLGSVPHLHLVLLNALCCCGRVFNVFCEDQGFFLVVVDALSMKKGVTTIVDRVFSQRTLRILTTVCPIDPTPLRIDPPTGTPSPIPTAN